MKDYIKNITNLLLIAVVAILLFQRGCSTDSNPINTHTITEVVTKYDTINTVSKEYIPIWNTKVIHDTKTITEYIDTNVVIDDYYTQYHYQDTIKVDTFGYVIINDTIFKNKLQSRKVIQDIIIPTTTITNNTIENKREFYLGLGSNVTTKGNITFVGTDLLFKTKKKQIIRLGVGLDQEFNTTITAGLYWKLGE